MFFLTDNPSPKKDDKGFTREYKPDDFACIEINKRQQLFYFSSVQILLSDNNKNKFNFSAFTSAEFPWMAVMYFPLCI